jgi:ligand-binding sensor domain-containing protein
LAYDARALVFLAALSACGDGQATGDDHRAVIAHGRVVAELDPATFYIFQATDDTYWFGSNDRGVYRYDGHALVNFTTDDGLASNRIRGIQEDAHGNIYFTTYEGISRFDGRAFVTLSALAEADAQADAEQWKLQPDDLWFVGPPDAGVVFRYDGTTLHRVRFPTTKLGDEHFERMPRSRFPSATYSPYDVYSILRDSRGNLWFGTSNVGVGRFDGTSFHWFTDGTLIEAPVRSILEDSQGNFWFTYTGHAPFDGFRAVKDFGVVQDGAEGRIVGGMSVVEDDAGAIWTAAYAGGAFRYDGEQATQFSIKEGDTTITVFAISKDNHGTLWLGTHNGGAYRFDGVAFERFTP